MIAIDTNILIYSIDRTDGTKWVAARALLRSLERSSEAVILPWQVAGEFLRYLRAQRDRCRIDLETSLRQFRKLRVRFPIVPPTVSVLDAALDLSARYSLSHWDSMLLGACLEAGVTTLYTEDMGAPVTIDGLQLANPFE